VHLTLWSHAVHSVHAATRLQARAATPAWGLKLDLLLSFWVLQPLWAALVWLLALVRMGGWAGRQAGWRGGHTPCLLLRRDRSFEGRCWL
jgi:hypothetical protein